VSQGICFPLGVLPEGTPAEVGADVTDALGVIKHDPPPPASLAGRVKGSFPAFIPKTDETRVQVLEKVLRRHRGKTFNVTEKLDGSSFTAFFREGVFGVCSRNLLLDESDESHLFTQVATRQELAVTLARIREKHGFDLAVQGEVIGPGIQANKYALRAAELRVFNLYDISACRLVDHDRALDLLSEHGLMVVPQLGTIVLDHGVDELIQLSEGVSVLNSKVQREGIVLRPNVEEFDEDLGGRLSFKAINPQFLLKYDE
jgi:RNA ligase (TIGR02306 family)